MSEVRKCCHLTLCRQRREFERKERIVEEVQKWDEIEMRMEMNEERRCHGEEEGRG